MILNSTNHGLMKSKISYRRFPTFTRNNFRLSLNSDPFPVGTSDSEPIVSGNGTAAKVKWLFS